MAQLSSPIPTLLTNKAFRIILPAVAIVVINVLLALSTGLIDVAQLHLFIGITFVAGAFAGMFHERLFTLARRLDG